MKRRTFLTASIATVGSVTLAGCNSTSNGNPGGGGESELDGVEADPDQLPAPSLGDGPVTLETFEDFSCGHCHTFKLEHFPRVKSELIDTGKITYHHVDFPLGRFEHSEKQANAARAVQADTMTDEDPAGAFFEFQKQVYETGTGNTETLLGYAEDVGADRSVVETAIEEETYYPTLKADRQHGIDRGVNSTPTGLLDDGSSYGVSSASEVDSLIEDVRNS